MKNREIVVYGYLKWEYRVQILYDDRDMYGYTIIVCCEEYHHKVRFCVWFVGAQYKVIVL